MEDNELIGLRKEVARLTQLLDIVLLRNAQLEQQLSASQQGISSSQTKNTSIHKSSNGAKEVNNSNDFFVNGGRNTDSSHDSFVNGVNEATCSHDTFVNGGKDNLCSVDKTVNGVSDVIIAHDESVNGGITPPVADLQTNTGGNPVQKPPSISTPAAVPSKTALVQAKLRKLMPKSGRRSIRNTAAMLLSLQQTPKQSVKDLQKLTGMSEDGMTKRIMSLKKYGLITRVRGTGLVLTPKALEIVGDE